jgi:hypothetical protein
MKKYKMVKMPLEAWENLKKKKYEMEEAIKQETNKPKFKIPFTNFTSFISEKPTRYIYNDELVNYFVGNSRKKKRTGGMLL